MKKHRLLFWLLSLMLVMTLALPAAAEGEGSGGDNVTAPPCSHAYGPAKVTKNPSCTEAGTATVTCTKCQHTENREVKKLDHSYGTGKITVSPTCQSEGEAYYVCLVCGHEKTAVLQKLTTHTYDNSCDADCNVCGYVRSAGHKIYAGWYSRSSGHYHLCQVCNKEVDTGNHFPGPAATEEKDQLCLTCGYVMTKKKSHVHQLSETMQSDETNHWKTCANCDQLVELAAHTFDGDCDDTCDVCGYVSEYAHSYADVFQMDEQNHWVECTLCGKAGNLEAHMPGTAADEEKTQYCAICGMELNPALAHVHTPGTDWETDGDSHWHGCTDCGEAADLAAHRWDTGVEGEDGSVTYTCTVCAAVKSESDRAPVEAEEGETEQTAGPSVWIAVAIAALVSGAAGAGIAVLVLTKAGKKKHGKFDK